MKDLSTVAYHPTSENIVDVLCKKTQSTSPLFFRVLVSYYLCKVAATMRAKVGTHDRGKIPVNCYAINLATSGFGKGHSTNIVEEQVINQFKDIFMEETLPVIAEENLNKLAVRRAARKSVEPEEELAKVEAEFARAGELVFSFSEGTSPAVKQMRHRLLMAGAGAVNLEIDEIGSNLIGNLEVLNTFLELFDVGKVKTKLTKNTAENTRSEEIDGKTPANMMLFGTPSKLLNGGKEEQEFYSMLETGYARRSIFGYSRKDNSRELLTPTEIYAALTDNSVDGTLQAISDQLGMLADYVNFDKVIAMSKDVSIEVIGYKQECEILADELPEHDEIRKAEISHRYFKALKLAGAYAFIDSTPEVTSGQWWAAVKLVEESGAAFDGILTRDRNYVKLAKYIAAVGREVTHVDMTEDLPFYRGSNGAKQELMNLAVAYGYKNNIIIKKYFNGTVEFFRGESLQETNLDEMVVAYGEDFACDYRSEHVPFDSLHKLTQVDGYHWTNHHLDAGDGCECIGHRDGKHVKTGFNMIIIDVDGGTPMKLAQNLLKDYKCMLYTTKRHTETENRYRIVFPMNYLLKLDEKDYKEFMNNFYEWLPFSSDEETNQRCKKWMSHDGSYSYNDGELVDALMFIPKTSKNEERKQAVDNLNSLNNLERWFVTNTGEGGRNNQMLKFALMLVDSGFSFDEVRDRVLDLNGKISDSLEEVEIHSTILISAAKAIAAKD